MKEGTDCECTFDHQAHHGRVVSLNRDTMEIRRERCDKKSVNGSSFCGRCRPEARRRGVPHA